MVARLRPVKLSFVGQDKTGKAVKSISGNIKHLTGVLKVAATAYAGVRLVGMAKQATDAADKIHKLNLRLGISTEKLSVYEHAAKRAGTSLDAVVKGVQKVSQRLVEADSGLSTVQDDFARLGVDWERLLGLRPEEQFEIVAQKIRQIRSDSERIGLVSKLFGARSAELIPLFRAETDSIKEIENLVVDVGGALTKAQANKLAKIKDDMADISLAFGTIGKMLALEFAPHIESAAGTIIKVAKELKKTQDLLGRGINPQGTVASRLAEGTKAEKPLMILGHAGNVVSEGAKAVHKGVKSFLLSVTGKKDSRERWKKQIQNMSSEDKDKLRKVLTARVKAPERVSKLKIRPEESELIKATKKLYNSFFSKPPSLKKTSPTKDHLDKTPPPVVPPPVFAAPLKLTALPKLKPEDEARLLAIKETAEMFGNLGDVIKGSTTPAIIGLMDGLHDVPTAIESILVSIRNSIIEQTVDSFDFGDTLVNLGKSVAESFFGGASSAATTTPYRPSIAAPQKLLSHRPSIAAPQNLLPARASGGKVHSGQPYLIGERGAEIFIPRTTGNVIPNHATGKGAGNNNPVNLVVNIINNTDSSVTQQEGTAGEIDIIIDRKIAQQLGTSGSQANRALTNRGLPPAPVIR